MQTGDLVYWLMDDDNQNKLRYNEYQSYCFEIKSRLYESDWDCQVGILNFNNKFDVWNEKSTNLIPIKYQKLIKALYSEHYRKSK